MTGCGPTYPKEKFKESIIRVCKDEYKLDVKVETVGKTVAIYVPLPDLLDFTFAITKQASEKINDVILSVSRVALSTDAKLDFYCVIAHDIRIPEIQIVIIKSVDDVKRFLLNDVSRNEYSKRMLIDIRLNPQSQKERSVKDIMEKMKVDRGAQEEVMKDFFRSAPTGLGEFGYWNDRFYIKDILPAEFLAEQIASRIKIDAREDKDFFDLLIVKSSKGTYTQKDGRGYFRFEILAEPKWFKEEDEEEFSKRVFHLTLRIASQVIRGYRFVDFDYAEVIDLSGGKTLEASREELELFRNKKIGVEDLIK